MSLTDHDIRKIVNALRPVITEDLDKKLEKVHREIKESNRDCGQS